MTQVPLIPVKKNMEITYCKQSKNKHLRYLFRIQEKKIIVIIYCQLQNNAHTSTRRIQLSWGIQQEYTCRYKIHVARL